MSTREKIIALLDGVPEYKMGYILAYVQGLTADEDADDAFCQQMYERYQNDPEKDEEFTLEECKREWGLIEQRAMEYSPGPLPFSLWP